MTRFDQYLVSLILPALGAAIAIFALLLLLVRMAELSNFVVAQGGAISTVGELVLYLIPQYVVLALPVGLALSLGVAFRQMAIANELDVLSAAGISHLRLLRAPLLLAGVIAAGQFVLVGWVQPLSAFAYARLYDLVQNGQVLASIRIGEFITLDDHTVLHVERTDRRGETLEGIFVSRTQGERMTVALAARGQILQSQRSDKDFIVLRLFDGSITDIDLATGARTIVAFQTHEVRAERPTWTAFRQRGERAREQTLPELFAAIANTDENAPCCQASASLARRSAQLLSIFVIPFLALALAPPAKRSESTAGVAILLMGFLVYNELSLFAERAGAAGQAPAVSLQAAVLLVFAVLTGLVFRHRTNLQLLALAWPLKGKAAAPSLQDRGS